MTTPAAHPSDDEVILGSLGMGIPDAAAVVSLCQVGREDFAAVPAGDRIEVWLVDHPGEVEVSEVAGDQNTVIELRVARSDIGKVIGKEGRTAQSMRTILSAVSQKLGRRAHLDIVD